MATYTETFPNDGTLGTATEDLTWQVGTAPLNPPAVVVSGQCKASGSSPNSGMANAQHAITGTDFFVEVDILNNTLQGVLVIQAGSDAGPPGASYVSIFAQIVDLGIGNGSEVQIQDYETSAYIAPITDFPALSVIATWRLEVEGDEARLYRNGVLLISGTGVNAYRPIGSYSGFEIYNDMAIDNYSYGDLSSSSIPGPISATSDIPFLVGNDRYQVVALAKQGTSTVAPEFRYWYAGPAEWDSSLA